MVYKKIDNEAAIMLLLDSCTALQNEFKRHQTDAHTVVSKKFKCLMEMAEAKRIILLDEICEEDLETAVWPMIRGYGALHSTCCVFLHSNPNQINSAPYVDKHYEFPAAKTQVLLGINSDDRQHRLNLSLFVDILMKYRKSPHNKQSSRLSHVYSNVY